MTLRAADEHPHPTPPGAPATWQENWFFMGCSPEGDSGFYLHVGRLPARHELEVKAMVIVGDEVVSAAVRHRLGPGLEAPGVAVEFADPFATTHLSLEGTGRVGPGPGMFFATGEGGEARLGLEVTLRATAAAVDWSQLLARMAVDGTEGTHYEQGHGWEASLRAGERSVQASGLGVRDHTWGAREYEKFQTAWWTPMTFDDGTYLTGVSVGVDGRWVGGGLVVDTDGPRLLAHAVEVTDGEEDAGRYGAASVTLGDGIEVRSTTRLHLPVPYPAFGSPFLSSEAYSLVEWDGRRGFGSVEYNRSLRAPELELLGLH